MTEIIIYRPPATEIVTVDIDEKTVYNKKLMGDWHITAEFNVSSVINVQIGDYIVFESQNYYINRLPDIGKLNNSTFKYNISFEHALYNLKKKLFISADGLADFSYNGTPEDFVTNIVASINEIDAGWTVGTVAVTEEQTLQFVNESCHAALMRVAEAFELEWQVIGKAIHLIKAAGVVRALTFEYGRGKGLYNLIRQQVRDQNIITRLFGYGGEKNISDSYRNRAKRLIFEAPGFPPGVLENNIAYYGVIEGQYTNNNIFPQRTSVLTGVHTEYADVSYSFRERVSYFEDSTMDFNLNDHLIEGKIAMMVFKTGDLAGVECEIWKYDNANKRFYIRTYADSDGYTLPRYNAGSPIEPKTGDSYTLVNISMPQTYIDTAEAELLAATQESLAENSVPQIVYQCDFDPKYGQSINLSLDVGDRVRIIDADLAVDAQIRVSGIEFPLVSPYRIKAVIADFVPYTLQERIIKNGISTKKETVFVDRRSVEQARRNTLRQQQMQGMIFDTDGYFETENIRPLSIETSYLAIGAKSRGFWLAGVTIKANYGGNANAINVSTGSLVHLQIKIEGLGYTWAIAPVLNRNDLVSGTAYYLYARCSTTGLTGGWVLSSSQIAVDDETGYYHFLIGMLFAVSDGYRDFDFAYGMTYINGNTITTGRIKSIDDENYFDLTQNQFRVGDNNSSLDWNVTTAGTLTIKGALVQSPAGTFPVTVFCGPYEGSVTYQKGNQVTYDGASWNYINDVPASGVTPASGAYWLPIAIGGAIGPAGPPGAAGPAGNTGPGVVFRGNFTAVAQYYNNSLRRDIVRYSGSYYIYKGADGASEAWNAANWDSFGGQFSSVATDILFADLAYVENLGVRHFSGIPIPAGDLNGVAQNVVANVPFSPTWNFELEYSINDKVSWLSTNYVCILGHSGHQPPNLTYWITDPAQPTHQVDRVVINSGSSGIIRITCNGNYHEAQFNTDYAHTMQDWINVAAPIFDAGGVVVSGVGASAWLTSRIAGQPLSPSANIVNVPNPYRGSLVIEGNDLYINNEDNDAYGFLSINRKGYMGGTSRPRHLNIFNGQGIAMMTFNGGRTLYSPHGSMTMFSEFISLPNLPTANTYLQAGMLYRSGNDIKIKI